MYIGSVLVRVTKLDGLEACLFGGRRARIEGLSHARGATARLKASAATLFSAQVIY